MSDLANTTPERHALAVDWHGGQASMLYAIASTGELTRGTRRPYGDDGPMTDDEWSADLVYRLHRELSEIADDPEDGDAIRAWIADLPDYDGI